MPLRILVVDAHPLNRLVVADQLFALGHAPLCTDAAEDAWDLLEVGRFDLVFVACRMPMVDGFAFAQRARDDAIVRGAQACPIVGYSSDATLDGTLASQCGMHACLPMPIPHAMLESLLRPLVAQRGAVPPARNVAQWDLFVATSREDLRLARACVVAHNLVQLRTLFHRIKGAALMLGATDLAAACARGEAGCDDWGNHPLDAAIDLVEAQLDAAHAAQWEPSR